MTTLVIVESPGKVKKISALLGPGYKVVASVGHVRDLPPKELGIEPPDFRPHYEPTERGRDVLARLRKDVAQADRVILATDPDREGEAIAWHLADALRLRNPERITFTAITKEQVRAAIEAPRQINMQRVRSQEARRALDRIVGYRVSPALSSLAGQPLSAGRVQSPAVRLVVDREREIAAFRSTEHYSAELTFDNADGSTWRALWDTKPHLAEGQPYMLDEALARAVAAVRHVTVVEYADTVMNRAPAAPFTTSTLQQAAGQRLKFRPKKTMELAQRLYEQGAITYHRTDNPNLDSAGIEDIAAYARRAGLPLADKPRRWKAKEGAQEGHEAIRPTHAATLDAGETDEERALYRLIWQRAVASQLADAEYAVRTVRLAGDVAGMPVTFTATGRTLQSPGWMTVYVPDPESEQKNGDDEDAAASNPIPVLTNGAALVAASGRMLTKRTKPPARFTEATLVKELERQGIGRPSTYATILENITTRGYVTTDPKGYLVPTPIGEMIRDALVGRFRFAELDYTRGLEDELDRIAEGQATYQGVVAAAWSALDDELTKLDTVKAGIAHPCPDCGKPLQRRKGQYGFFWSCTGYPECRTTLPDAKGKPGERRAPPPPTGFKCPKCGSELARRQGVSKPKKKGEKGRPYDFYSCTGFPKCDATYRTGPDGKPEIEAAAAAE